MTENHEQSTGRRQPFRLAEWFVEPDLNRVAGGGKSRQVEPRVMDLLVRLASRPGEVFTRDELMKSVWGEVVVGEESLTRAVSELRRVLEDESRSPRFVETIRKVGYRLVAPVTPVTAASGPSRPGPATKFGLRALGLAAALVALVAVVVWIATRPPSGTAPSATALRPSPLTSYPGEEQFPDISPDGNHVAFAWAGPGDDNVDVYVTQVGSESRLRLTEDPGFDTYPRWSADGATLAFIHAGESGQSIRSVPMIGGGSREVVRAKSWLGGHDWSPRGGALVYADGGDPPGPAQLFVRDLESGEIRPLIPRPSEGAGDIGPIYSPDGGTVAFVRADGADLHDIYLASVEDGSVRRLTRGLISIRGLDWTRDGRSLICSAISSAYYCLWRIDVDDGSVTRVPTRGEWVHFPSLALNADRLVYQDIWFDKNIWRIQRRDVPGAGLSTDSLIASTRWDCEATYSPDGSRIAFVSARSGSLELWISKANGSSPLQITRLDEYNISNPRWSPDGTQIAFHAGAETLPDLWVVGAGGGEARRLTHDGRGHLLASWSRDGEWLYFASDRGGDWDLWKLRGDETGAGAIQVTRGGGIAGFESEDGRTLYFARPDRGGLWRLSLDEPGAGEPALLVEDLPQHGDWGNWGVSDHGIVFIRRDDEGPMILYYDVGTGEMQPVTRVPNVAVPSLTVSPDGKSILYARIERKVSDLMLVEGFR